MILTYWKITQWPVTTELSVSQYRANSQWVKCQLAGSWNLIGLVRSGSDQHVEGQSCHFLRRILASTTSNQRWKNNQKSRNTYKLRFPRKTIWWQCDGLSGMPVKTSTNGGLPDKVSQDYRSLLCWSLETPTGQNYGEWSLGSWQDRCSSTRWWIAGRNVDLNLSNTHHIYLIWHPQTTSSPGWKRSSVVTILTALTMMLSLLVTTSSEKGSICFTTAGRSV